MSEERYIEPISTQCPHCPFINCDPPGTRGEVRYCGRCGGAYVVAVLSPHEKQAREAREQDV